MARPKNFTKKQLIDALEKANGVQKDAAKVLNTTPITISQYVKKWPVLKEKAKDFRRAYLEARREEKRQKAAKDAKFAVAEKGIEMAEELYGELNSQQRRFVQEYLVDLNAKGAARRAGYRNDADASWRLMQNPKVRTAIQRAELQRQLRTEIQQDHVINELAKVAFANITDFVDWDESGVRVVNSQLLDYYQKAAVAEVSEYSLGEGMRGVRVKFHNKLDALTKLGQHLGMFNKDSSNVQVQMNIRAEQIRMTLAEKLDQVAQLSEGEIKRRLSATVEVEAKEIIEEELEEATA